MKIEFNNTIATVYCKDDIEKERYHALRRSMQVLAPGAIFTPSYIEYKKSKGKRGWDGKANILAKSGSFPTGLVPNIVEKFYQHFKFVPTLRDIRNHPPNRYKETKVSLREYQKETVDIGLNHTLYDGQLRWNRGVIEIGTGGGKTEISVALFEKNPVKSLFIVNSKSLAAQAVTRFKKYNITCGKLFTGYEELDKDITVATIQTIHSKSSKLLPFLLSIEQVFFDECHAVASSLAKGNTFFQVSAMLENAYFRWGLSATPFMKDQYSNWLLAGAAGSVLHSIPATDLIDMGYLVPPKIMILEPPKISGCPRSFSPAYDAAIVMHRERNKMIIDQLKTCPKPAIVLVKRIAHLKILDRMTKEEQLSSVTLQGEDDLKKRKRVLKSFGKTRDILITSLFKEGFDFDEIKTVIIAEGGRSVIKTIQRVGRGMRIAQNKNEVIIVDFNDTSCKVLKDHSRERIKIYEEQGFKVCLV